KVAVAVINNNFAASNGLIAKKDGIFVEDEKSPYVNIIVSREDNKEDEKVISFAKAYQSEEVATVAEEVFKGGAIKGWKFLFFFFFTKKEAKKSRLAP